MHIFSPFLFLALSFSGVVYGKEPFPSNQLQPLSLVESSAEHQAELEAGGPPCYKAIQSSQCSNGCTWRAHPSCPDPLVPPDGVEKKKEWIQSVGYGKHCCVLDAVHGNAAFMTALDTKRAAGWYASGVVKSLSDRQADIQEQMDTWVEDTAARDACNRHGPGPAWFFPTSLATVHGITPFHIRHVFCGMPGASGLHSMYGINKYFKDGVVTYSQRRHDDSTAAWTPFKRGLRNVAPNDINPTDTKPPVGPEQYPKQDDTWQIALTDGTSNDYGGPYNPGVYAKGVYYKQGIGARGTREWRRKAGNHGWTSFFPDDASVWDITRALYGAIKRHSTPAALLQCPGGGGVLTATLDYWRGKHHMRYTIRTRIDTRNEPTGAGNTCMIQSFYPIARS